MLSAWSKASLFIGLIAILYTLYRTSPSLRTSLCAATYPANAERLHSGYFGYECAGKPHHSSWSSWWHPERSDGIHEGHMGAGAITERWNILYHLGGNGPWVEKVIDVVDGGIVVPEGCEIEQVHMMSRHAERYPTRRAGDIGQRAVVERMKQSGKTFTGNLAFFNRWQLFWTDDSSLEQLTSTGPFSGTLGSFTTGVRLRTRYKHLQPDRTTTFWASDSNRVIETAKYFALGFFGIDYQDSNTAALEVISEHFSLGADTLTPGRTCLANKRDEDEGQRKGYRLMGEYRATYLSAIRERLLEQTTMDFNDQEIYAMQEMCGFETTVRGRSDWCDVFTQDEFLSFEYARDLLHYYRAGPGQKYAASMGWLWLNATTNLLLEGPGAGPLFFSFVHDGDIAPMITALDVINDVEHLPINHIPHSRKWRKSQVSPMGGRVIFELLNCNQTSSPGKFVRLNINDGITAVPGCDNGPGNSCPLAQFAARTKKKGEEVGDFRELCGLDENAAGRITFLHQ
ncbi:phosphoglycerate mutase-like protein [Cucurbitaria berberidis CBS 394.84]|uniref:Phosphoglycerate mutase-like protein n=1 Tax=Cucurbitaria berberidis CBS 394.84 TaxID=1168544 RepID=A0A9P4GU90_9PLEO|nr:phosphoglycerate mutase-like protein [Cucurbitaria berberidis CBS 394.84]KAF1851927.1 phosphoglycerate mutase-like protein [Cucurbitaria berberidis CBS 394.84]